MIKLILGLIFTLPLIFAMPVLAGLGVGVSSGKIVLDNPLRPGSISVLPKIVVMNTGDIPARYELGISKMEAQPELAPEPFWFSYNPPSFELAPGEAQPVEVTLTLPFKVVPGSYFALVEAHPVLSGEGAQVGIAAASKLYFEVQAANLIAGVFYRAKTVWNRYEPYNNYLVATVATVGALKVASSYFGLTIAFKKRKSA